MLRSSAALVFTAAALLAPSCALASGEPSEDASVAAFHRTAIDTAASFSPRHTVAGRREIVILQPWQVDEMRKLKAADPGVQVLMYKNLGFVSSSRHDSGRVASGISLSEAERNPRWLLRDAADRPLASRSYHWLWAADVGDPAYQARWSEAVLGELGEAPWDGVFIDDVNSSLRYHVEDENRVEDAADDAYGDAMAAALETIGPRIESTGRLVIANVCCEADTPGRWAQYLTHVSGAMAEQFVKWGDGDASLETYAWDWGPSGWETYIRMGEQAAARDKRFLAVTHSAADDGRALRYGLASYLLAAGPRSSFDFVSDYATPIWSGQFEVARALGMPRGARREVAGGAHLRAFDHGVAVVNPSRADVRVDLPRGLYLDADRGLITEVELPSRTGAVLTSVDLATFTGLPAG